MKLALTKLEKEVLFRKYKQNGLSTWEANNKLEKFVTYLREMVREMQRKNKQEHDIHNKFKEEFELMCRKLEV